LSQSYNKSVLCSIESCAVATFNATCLHGKTFQQDDIYKERKIIFSPHVECEGKVKNGFYLSAKGNVFPCKHVAANVTTAHDSPEHIIVLLYDWDKNNISNNNLETIFTNDFYKGYFNNLLKLNPQVLHNEQEGIC
jgi:hypothetical protein